MIKIVRNASKETILWFSPCFEKQCEEPNHSESNGKYGQHVKVEVKIVLKDKKHKLNQILIYIKAFYKFIVLFTEKQFIVKTRRTKKDRKVFKSVKVTFYLFYKSFQNWKIRKSITFSKPKFFRTASPLGMGQMTGLSQVMFFTPSHWLIARASLPYMNHDKYFNQINQLGTDLWNWKES